jgi:hypothetical protein
LFLKKNSAVMRVVRASSASLECLYVHYIPRGISRLTENCDSVLGFDPGAASSQFMRFYTQPRLVIYMPDEPEETNYGDTLFRRIQDVMLEGGFSLWDLG